MNNERDKRLAVPAWVWAATAVALVSILGAVLLASMAPDERMSANQTTLVPPEGQPAGAGPAPMVTNQPPPEPTYPRRSAPRVTVTEVEPPLRQVAPDVGTNSVDKGPKPKPKTAAPRLNVRDMFPVGPLERGASQSTGPDRAPTEHAEESFPAFGHNGRQWAFTGRYALARQVELTPTDANVDGRTVYSLSGDDGQSAALFVQSRSNPGRYAIYRPTG